MRKKLAVLLAVCLLFVCGTTMVSAGENTTYTYTLSVDGDWIRTQDAYMPGNIYLRDLGLNKPEDIFIKGDLMYVADTGNSRVVVYNMKDKSHTEFGNDVMESPRGLFVADDGTVYVADKSGVLFIYDSQKVLKKEIGRPDSYLFSEISAYAPKNVVVTKEGNIFLCSEDTSEGILQFDSEGEFQGYFAANRKYLTIMETIEDMILSDEMKQDLLMRRPRAIYNIDIDDRDLIYSVTQTDEFAFGSGVGASKQENALKQHNLAGVNIMSRNEFMKDEWNFVDVAAGNNGNVYAVTYTGLIYEYDSEGSLVFSFAGRMLGMERTGVFAYASAIEVDDDGFIYVLERDKGYVQVFYPTDFAVATHQAIHDLENGNYESSEQTWATLLSLNGMSRIAHMGYGKTLFHQQRFSEALSEFRIAQDRDYYSDTFWELRDAWLGNNIIYFVAVILVIAVAMGIISLIKKRRPAKAKVKMTGVPAPGSSRFLHDITYFRYMLKHPIDGYYYLKHGQAGSMRSAGFMYFILFLVFAADTMFRGFVFGFASMEDAPLLMMAIVFVVVIALFLLGNYMVATINEGEGSMRNLFTMLPYALSPYIVITPFIVAATYVLTLNEGFLVTFGWTVAVLWSVALIFIGLTETHNYSFWDTVKNVLLTLFFMIIAIIAVAVLYLLWLQVITFVQDVWLEVVYRVQQSQL
ncbi:MAG: hypothetical protein IJN07_03560 [Clostridia bacterium]|nr:hypothetical protein [Clostridia bacterium]